MSEVAPVFCKETKQILVDVIVLLHRKKKINVAESPQGKKKGSILCLGNVCVCIFFPFNFNLGGYN